jgi:hypothetical protein
MELMANITDISNIGEVTVTFNKELSVPTSYENINKDVIQIKIITKK